MQLRGATVAASAATDNSHAMRWRAHSTKRHASEKYSLYPPAQAGAAGQMHPIPPHNGATLQMKSLCWSE